MHFKRRKIKSIKYVILQKYIYIYVFFFVENVQKYMLGVPRDIKMYSEEIFIY